MPERIQQKRTKGWRKPDGAVSVARPSKWGNPYTLEWARGYLANYAFTDFQLQGFVVQCFQTDLIFVDGFDYPTVDEIRAELRGKDLMCWCPLDLPCHADVLLELANRKEVDVGGEDEV